MLAGVLVIPTHVEKIDFICNLMGPIHKSLFKGCLDELNKVWRLLLALLRADEF